MLLFFDNYVNLQKHGFSEPSEKAYDPVIYVRSTSHEGHSETHLVCSKSRIDPMKSLCYLDLNYQQVTSYLNYTDKQLELYTICKSIG